MSQRSFLATSPAMLKLHLITAMLLLLMIPVERSFPVFGAIQDATTPWAVDITADPLYAARAFLMILNGIGLVASAGLTLIMAHQAVRQQAPAGMALLSGSWLWFIAAKAVLLAPYWINGVGSALIQRPAFDMDPKALIPAIWTPFWQPLTFALTLLLMLALPVLEGMAVWHALRSRRWPTLIALQLPLALSWLLFRLAPSLGPWLAD